MQDTCGIYAGYMRDTCGVHAGQVSRGCGGMYRCHHGEQRTYQATHVLLVQKWVLSSTLQLLHLLLCHGHPHPCWSTALKREELLPEVFGPGKYGTSGVNSRGGKQNYKGELCAWKRVAKDGKHFRIIEHTTGYFYQEGFLPSQTEEQDADEDEAKERSAPVAADAPHG